MESPITEFCDQNQLPVRERLISGSVASLFWNPLGVKAGASGAIFGIYGALLGILLRQYGSIPAGVLAQLRNSGLGFLFYNLLYGMTKPNIDSAAHIGGLVGGFLCGIVLSQPFRPESLAGRPVRNLLAGGLGVILVIGGMIGVYANVWDVAKVQIELERFEVVEDALHTAVAKAQRRELTPEAFDDPLERDVLPEWRAALTDAAFADLLERDVLPEWRAARERLSALKHIPAALQGQVTSLLFDTILENS